MVKNNHGQKSENGSMSISNLGQQYWSMKTDKTRTFVASGSAWMDMCFPKINQAKSCASTLCPTLFLHHQHIVAFQIVMHDAFAVHCNGFGQDTTKHAQAHWQMHRGGSSGPENQ